jgi:hypothetical protein
MRRYFADFVKNDGQLLKTVISQLPDLRELDLYDLEIISLCMAREALQCPSIGCAKRRNRS